MQLLDLLNILCYRCAHSWDCITCLYFSTPIILHQGYCYEAIRIIKQNLQNSKNTHLIFSNLSFSVSQKPQWPNLLRFDKRLRCWVGWCFVLLSSFQPESTHIADTHLMHDVL